METARMRLGRSGEDAACKYLIGKGHKIIERNWRSGHLEIDIISISEGTLHFVEVKSRVAPVSALPEENVGYKKQQKIISAANKYLHSKSWSNSGFDYLDISFDVISIIFEGELMDISYFPQAYIPIFT